MLKIVSDFEASLKMIAALHDDWADVTPFVLRSLDRTRLRSNCVQAEAIPS